ncbi:MAG TPA: hypothetical protein VIT45_03755 [Allosphingosinicella sp.]
MATQDRQIGTNDSPAAKLAAALGTTTEKVAAAFYPGTDDISTRQDRNDSPAAKLAKALNIDTEQVAKVFYPGTDD